MKKSALALSLAIATLAAPVMAEETAPVNLNDAQQVFAVADGNNLQLASLSQTEMKETQGAVYQYVALGAAGGIFGGLGYASAVPRNQRTWQGWTMAIGSGAVGGMVGGVPLGTFRTAFYGGTVGFVGNSWATSSWGRR